MADPKGIIALGGFVDHYPVHFTIGATDGTKTAEFGQWGPRRLLVPQLFLIDKAGVVQGQFMGADSIFEGDRVGALRAAINKMMGVGTGPSKALPAKK